MEKKANSGKIKLVPMTPEMYDLFFREFENDPDLYADPGKFVPYAYSKEAVAKYVQRQRDLNRISLAILYEEEIVGEIVFKNIEEDRSATLSITLKNSKCKNRGIGTEAERLAVRYAFEKLNIPILYADTIQTNTRSQHVLEKVGFTMIREDREFKYYRITHDFS